MDIVWKRHPAIDFLEVSNSGMIRTTDREIVSTSAKGNSYTRKVFGKLLTPTDNGTGYLQVNVSESGSIRKYYVHRLVYETHNGEISEGYEINHIDHDKSNNKVENLEEVCHSDNMSKMREYYGIAPSVEKCPSCGMEKSKRAIVCMSCSSILRSSITTTESEIEDMVSEFGWRQAAKLLGVSDNGLRKYYKRSFGKDPKLIRKSK